MTFTKKKIEQGTRVCLRLKQAREAKNVSLRQLAARTHINKKYLQALEECRFEDLPHADIYKRQFLKRYLTALNIDPTSFVKQFNREECEDTEETRFHPHATIRARYFQNLPFLFQTAAVLLVVIAIIGYLGIQVRNIIEPPQLSIFSPTNGHITEESMVVVEGETEKEVSVSINGKEIFNDEHGRFQEEINLKPGLNTLVISAKRRHGKTTQEIRHITLKNAQQFTLRN